MGARTLCNACGLQYAKLQRSRGLSVRSPRPEAGSPVGSPTAAGVNGSLTPHGPGTPRTPRSPRPSSRGAGSAGPAAATAAARPAGKALGIAAMRLASTGHLIPQQAQSLPQAPAARPKLGRSSSLTDLHEWQEDAMGSPHLRSPPMPVDPPEGFAPLGGSPAAAPPPLAASTPLTVPRMDSFASSSTSSMALAAPLDVALAPMAAAPPSAAAEGPGLSELDSLVEFSPGMADMALKYGGMHFSTDLYPATGLGTETASGTGSVGTALHPSGSFGSGLDSDLGILLWHSDSSLEGGPLDLHASVHN